MFGISHPDFDDWLGWLFLSIPATMIVTVVIMYASGCYPSYSKLSGEGTCLGNKNTPNCIKDWNVKYKPAMFMCYFPAYLLVPIIACTTIFLKNTDEMFLVTYSTYFWVNLIILMSIYAKRCFEVLFVHIYSRQIGNLPSFVIIWSWYSMMTSAATYSMVTDLNTKNNIKIESNVIILIGTIIFLVGALINGWSHWRMASMRKGQNKINSKYATLEELGKLFQILKAPQFYGEILIWFGLFITMRSLTMFLFFAACLINMVARIYRTTKWYKTQLTKEQIGLNNNQMNDEAVALNDK